MSDVFPIDNTTGYYVCQLCGGRVPHGLDHDCVPRPVRSWRDAIGILPVTGDVELPEIVIRRYRDGCPPECEPVNNMREQRNAALALVREAMIKVESLGYSISLNDEPNPDRVTQLAAIDAWLSSARALLGEAE